MEITKFMISKEGIEEFKKLYAKNYGVELSDEEAIYRANNLVALYRAVYGNNSEICIFNSEKAN